MRRIFLLAVAAALCACSGSSNNDTDLADASGDSGTDAGDLQEEPGDLVPDPELMADVDVDGVDVPQDVPGDVQPGMKGWRLLPLAPKADLLGVWGEDGTYLAVGRDGTVSRRQGSFWTPLKSPTDKDLHCVFGESPDDVYAAGEAGNVFHFDGTAWQQIEHGITGLKDIVLRGAWGEEGHLYLVGDSATILHKAGPQWSKEEGITSYSLHSIWGTSLVDIYVGAAGGSLLRRIGNVWSSAQVTSGGVTVYTVRGLSPTQVWAGGSKGAIVALEAGKWTSKLSNDVAERPLRGVWPFSEEDVWFIGEGGALVHRKGGKWTLSPIAGPYYSNHDFYGLWGTQGDDKQAWAVGENGAVLHFDGTDWRDEVSGPSVDIQDVAGIGWEQIVAVGGDGLVLHFDGEVWQGLKRVTGQELLSVARVGEGWLAVGKGGVMVDIQGMEVSLHDSELTDDLLGICSDGQLTAVVGPKGAVRTSVDLATWTKVPTGLFDTLKGCVVVDGTVYAVGEKGAIVKVKDSSASKIPTASQVNLNDIAADDDGLLYAVGDNGILLHGDGQGFDKLHEESGLFLYGIHVVDGAAVAVGWSGQVLVYQDGEGKRVEVEDGGVLNAVWGPDADRMFAVGRNGQMVIYTH